MPSTCGKCIGSLSRPTSATRGRDVPSSASALVSTACGAPTCPGRTARSGARRTTPSCGRSGRRSARSSRTRSHARHGEGARVRPLVLLFDLDGTLTDPRRGIVRCLKHALGTLRAACPPDDVLASFIGPPLRETFATLLETSDRDLIERAVALYREEYGETGLFENRIYGGGTPMLRRCLH